MTTALTEHIARTTSPATQATQIEQARAVAEVQAAVTVAQACPRDMARAEGEMRDACGRSALANRAFFRVPNRGSGPSVHLMRELARIWGNVDYGVRELRRDDAGKTSEILAYAWDVQTNTRSTRTFVVPHQRMVTNKASGKSERVDLVDLGDVYLNNQNIGARAVRECINTVLPTWFTELAQDICHHTLREGDGKPLSQRIEEMVAAFTSQHGIKQSQIEKRLGVDRGKWDAGHVAQMTIIYQSLARGEIEVGDEFPDATVAFGAVTAASFPAPPPVPAPAPEVEPEQPAETGEAIRDSQRKAIFAAFTAAGFTTDARSAEGREARLAYMSQVLGEQIESTNDLTAAQASRVLDALNEDAQNSNEPNQGDLLGGEQ